jgi:hypothetical protein
MRPFLFLLLLGIAACGVKHSTFEYGKTTVAHLVQEKGQPLTEEIIPVKEGKVLHYSDDEKYQIKGDIVTSAFKTPKGDQKTLIYWKHEFKNCQTRNQKLPRNETTHEMPEWELACDEQGLRVIYTEGSEFVSRIVEYEKQ